MPGHDVGREHDAREQRRDLAPQVLARLERRGQLAQRAHGVAAGALLDRRSWSSAPRPRATAAGRCRFAERVLERLPDAAARRPRARSSVAGRVGELARGHAPAPAGSTGRRRRRWPASAPISGSCSMNASLRWPRRRSIRRARDQDRRRRPRPRTPATRATAGSSTTQPSERRTRPAARSARRASASRPRRPARRRAAARSACAGSGRRARGSGCARSPPPIPAWPRAAAPRCGSCRPAAATARARRPRPERPAGAAASVAEFIRPPIARRRPSSRGRAVNSGGTCDAGQHQPAQDRARAAGGARGAPRTRRSGPIGSASNSITDASRNVSRRCEATTATSLTPAAAVGEAVDLDDHVDRGVDLVAQRLERDLQLAHRGQRGRAGGSRRRRSWSAA